MSGAPAGALVAIGLLMLLLAAMLAAGETAVLRLSRSALAEIAASSLPSARRVRQL
ncbi:MAG: hypothetical protein JWP95_1456, partial [Actinotalea sp.]|nr:hypothetical protein [Actinotalea sp.]